MRYPLALQKGDLFIDECIGKEHLKINPHYEVQEDIAHIEKYRACVFNMTVQQAIRQHEQLNLTQRVIPKRV